MVQGQRLINEFLELVQIDSETGDEREICDHLKAKLTALGFHVVEDQSASQTGHTSGNIIATLQPSRSQIHAPNIFFCSHMDTVVPGKGVKPSICDGYIVSDGTTVLGSDDKAGIAAILEGIRVMNEQEMAHGKIQIVLTAGEESGVVGAKHFDPSLLHADYGYAVDSNGPVGEIIMAGVSQKKIAIQIKGKAAHAGVNPEEGISAVQIASKAIARMKLGRVDAETTANIGKIRGGTAMNIIPEGVEILAEVRSFDTEKLNRHAQNIMDHFQLAAEEMGGFVTFETVDLYPGFRFTESDPVIKTAVAAMENIGRIPDLGTSGGGSDANIFCGYGIPTVNLGIGYEKIHTTEERMPIVELHKAAEMIVSLIKENTLKEETAATKELAHV